jgi:CAAX prenyl protease-like protein
MLKTRGHSATAGYIAPFVAFVAVMAAEKALLPNSQLLYPIRFAVVLAVIFLFSRPYLSQRPSMPLASILVGFAVFAIWVIPDRVFHYRHFWLFQNMFTGTIASTIAPALKLTWWFLPIRILGSIALVPIAEELFWRGWMMRWLIDSHFERVPLGKYAPAAFWIVAILFASEHGPYWEVGLIAGVIYNGWLIRTRNLADCILAHAITNGLLAAWVLITGEWQYWL